MNRVLAVALVAVACLPAGGGCKKKEFDRPVEAPAPQVAPASPGVTTSPGGGGAPGSGVIQSERPVNDAEVRTRWAAVEFVVRDKVAGGASRAVKVPIGAETPVPGTALSVRVLGFVPDFAMGVDSVSTKSMNDANPAAKIQVLEGGRELFKGWTFRDFPDMHSFEDPRYTISLSRAIPAQDVTNGHARP